MNTTHRRCPNCDRETFPEDAYCAWCGAPVARAPETAPTTTWHSASAQPGDGASRAWATGAHLSALAGGFLGGIPAFVGPLFVWLARKDTDPYAAAHGRNALNFNLSVLVYAVALVVLTLFTFGLGLVITIPLGMLLAGGWLVLSIVGTLRALANEPYDYPLTIPFVRS